NDLKDAIADLKLYLGRMTGQEFASSANDAANGIVLAHVDSPGVPAGAVKALPADRKEAFVIWPDGDKRLWLVGRDDAGLTHAVSFYLEHLGCRWFAPSERWTIIPERKDIRIREAIALAPAFRSRFFFGSGGFGGNLPLDPKRELQGRWAAWTRRNHFGGEYLLAGHSGEGFNLKHKKVLEEHPEYRAMINGERVPWSQISKFCPSNQEVVDLFVKDRVDTYRQARKIDPTGPRSWAVSVEPADGGGHCDSPESRKIGSVSDRVFHVANQAAKAVRAEFPDGWVSLYAYNEHAAVPTIPLEPNVYVQVIPYAFQRTKFSPDQLLDAWSKKVSRMGIYDYWSIPDWSHDLPTFDFLTFGPERLRGWHRRGVDSFNCESTFSTGAMGPAWYIASRLAWNPKGDAYALFEDYVEKSFGPAAKPMKRMLTRWSEGFHLCSHELALSFRDIDEAWGLAEATPAMAGRVADYARYVEYLKRRFDYLQSKPKTDARRDSALRLMELLWGVYDSTMIHAFRHSQLLARDEALAGNENLGKDFDWRNPKAPGWATIHRFTDTEAREFVRNGVRDLKPLEYKVRRFAGPLVPLVEPKPSKGEYSSVLFVLNSQIFTVQSPGGERPFVLRLGCELSVRLTATDAKGEIVFEKEVATGKNWREDWSEVAIPLPKPGQYQVKIWSPRRAMRFSVPTDWLVIMDGWSNSQGLPTPRLYFYVPRETTRLAIFAEYIPAGPPRFFDPAGKEVKPELADGGKMIIVDIPEAQRGAVWSLDKAKCPIIPLVMLNSPTTFAFHPEALLVPRDAVKR
ncbi:MAG: DUF4838 domain-containing protein, partial [Planctomycetes bacterium]|nr:DUF4838 domain-containing protein [Planctomycetota bacterium]